LILPRADSRCGKVFFDDRRSADGHRVALEFWNRATGQVREGYRLAVYRCKRCGGFHIGHKRIESLQNRITAPRLDSARDFAGKPFPNWMPSTLASRSSALPHESQYPAG
jgi:hypothetical protein